MSSFNAEHHRYLTGGTGPTNLSSIAQCDVREREPGGCRYLVGLPGPPGSRSASSPRSPVTTGPPHRPQRIVCSMIRKLPAALGRITRRSSRMPTMSPQSRHASSTQAWRGTRGSATASRSCIGERVGGTPPKYAVAGSAPGCSSLVRPRRHRLPHADSRGNHLGLLRSGPTAAFVRVGHAMRTIEVTSVAPRAWARCNASSADAAWRVSSAK